LLESKPEWRLEEEEEEERRRRGKVRCVEWKM
jgi:hypothetical protein